MTVAKHRQSTSTNSPAASDPLQSDTAGVEVEDFGLDFDPPSPSTNAVSPKPPEPPTASVAESASPQSVWHLTHKDGRQEGPLLTEEIRRRMADGSLTSDSLIWRPGMPKWEPMNSVPEFQTSHSPEATDSLVSGSFGEIANVSGWIAAGLFMVSILGCYWGYSWFTGALMFFLAYLICLGIGCVLEALSQIKAMLHTQGKGQHD